MVFLMVEYSIESVGGFRVIRIKHDKSAETKLTVVVRTKEDKDFVFLPQIASCDMVNPEYPEHTINMLNRTGPAEYTLYFDSALNGDVKSVRIFLDENDVISEEKFGL